MKNTERPATPIELSGFGLYAPEAHYGLTKLEKLAETAMHAILSNPDALRCLGAENITVARASVDHAKELLRILEDL